MDWYVQSYPTGREAPEEASAGAQWFEAFEPAMAEFRRRNAAGHEHVRIMGPHSAPDHQIQEIIDAGGQPTFGG